MSVHRCPTCWQTLPERGAVPLAARILHILTQTDHPVSSTELYERLAPLGTTKASVMQTCRNLRDRGEIKSDVGPGRTGRWHRGWVWVKPEGDSPLVLIDGEWRIPDVPSPEQTALREAINELIGTIASSITRAWPRSGAIKYAKRYAHIAEPEDLIELAIQSGGLRVDGDLLVSKLPELGDEDEDA